jgi:asparagine N-glycosylation enzyme membrane subunit Stt3
MVGPILVKALTDQYAIQRRARLWELIALGLAVVGVAVRCLQWPWVFTGGEVVMMDTDNYYHLHRAWNLVTQFPILPFFDSFISFPAGAPVPWPIGFDLLLALPGLLGAGKESVTIWAVFVPPILGGIAVFLTYRLGKRAFDPLTGVVAAGFFALMQGAANFSLLGRVDHHALVAPVILGAFLSLLAALEAQTWGRRLAWSLAVGVLAAVAASSWIVTPALFFLPIPLTLFVLRFSPGPDVAKPVVWAGLGSAVLLTGLLVILSAPQAQSAFTLYQLSWIQVLPLALALVLLALAYYRLQLFLVCMALLVLAAPLLLWSWPTLLNSLTDALGVAAGNDLSYLLARESTSLLFDQGFFSPVNAAGMYTPLIFLFPIIVLVFVWRNISQRPISAPRMMVAIFSVLGGVLLFLQKRFGEYAAPAVALIFAWALIYGGRRLLLQMKEPGHRVRGRILAVAMLLVLGMALTPLVAGVIRMARPLDLYVVRERLLVFGRALAPLLPPHVASDGRPTYALLTGWNDSHLLLWVTGRAVAVSSFGTSEALAGNQKAFRLLLSSDEESCVRELDKARYRVIVVSSIFNQIQDMAAIAGLEEEFVNSSLKTNGRDLFIYREPRAPFWGTIHTRLFLGDGAARSIQDQTLQPLSHMRLILESKNVQPFFGAQPTSEYKAFEVVEGAKLIGQAPPGEKVFLRLTIETNLGRTFLYERETAADPSGRFSLLVPYETSGVGLVHSVGPYRLKIAGRVIHLDVTDEEIRNQQEVDVFSGKPSTVGAGE